VTPATSPGLASRPGSGQPWAVDNRRALPTRRDVFIDQRGAGLRVTWHPEQDLVVLSLWHDDSCVGTFRMPVQDLPRLSGLLAAALGDHLAPAAGSAPPRLAGEPPNLSVQQRLRLSRPVLRLRRLQRRRRTA
jgi:hypothetical protein